MSELQQKTKNAITLKGSAQLVSEYLQYGINNILFQRGIYPPESFKNEEHYGLSIYMSTDEKINDFLNEVLTRMKEWLLCGKLQKCSLVITNIANKEVLERWDFKLQCEKPSEISEDGKPVGNKELKKIQKEIGDVLRQICSTVSFLPLLDCRCSFDILIHTADEIDVPSEWSEAAPCFIANSEELQLRSFSTSLHKVDTVVSYKVDI